MADHKVNRLPRFRHCRLSSPRSIRLARLLPSIAFDAQLALELIEIELESELGHHSTASHSTIKYEALSYTWGSPHGTCPILCNDRLFLVTPNCESALRHIRLEHDVRVLWVDSICIDQTKGKHGIAERSVQVPLMGDIYAGARRTLCWLGEGVRYTDRVMRLLDQVGDCPSQRGIGKLLTLEEKLRNEGLLGDEESCLDHVFMHAWHLRIWTVQEVAFSDDCVVVCGRSSVSWHRYSRAAKFLIYDQFLEHLDAETAKSVVAIDVRDVLHDYISSHPAPSSSTSTVNSTTESDAQAQKVTFLISCLTDVNRLRATDPRDKIYGVYAMYSRLGVLLPAADYTKTIAEVYTDATVALIRWSTSLTVLSGACGLNRDSTLPSWVPDWSDGDARLYMPDANATIDSQIEHRDLSQLSPAVGKLHTRGRVIGHVVGQDANTISMPFPTRSGDVKSSALVNCRNDVVEDVDFLRLLVDMIRFFRALQHQIHSSPSVYCDDDETDVFLEIITLGKGIQGQGLSDSWDDLLDILSYPHGHYEQRVGGALAKTWMADDAISWSTETLHCTTIAATLLSNSLEPIDGYLPSNEDILDLIKELSQNLADQCVITFRSDLEVDRSSEPSPTTASLFLGTTFRTVQAGDTVALLEGASWPVVLRPHGKEWVFVSPAFVLGMMEGEAWPNQGRERATLTRFVLA